MCPDYAGEGTLIGYCEGLVSQLFGSLHQLAWMGSSQLEAEVGQTQQLCVFHSGSSRPEPLQVPAIGTRIPKQPPMGAFFSACQIVVTTGVLTAPPSGLNTLRCAQQLWQITDLLWFVQEPQRSVCFRDVRHIGGSLVI